VGWPYRRRSAAIVGATAFPVDLVVDGTHERSADPELPVRLERDLRHQQGAEVDTGAKHGPRRVDADGRHFLRRRWMKRRDPQDDAASCLCVSWY
jgi:hypothetical protein